MKNFLLDRPKPAVEPGSAPGHIFNISAVAVPLVLVLFALMVCVCVITCVSVGSDGASSVHTVHSVRVLMENSESSVLGQTVVRWEERREERGKEGGRKPYCARPDLHLLTSRHSFFFHHHLTLF